MNNHIIGKSLWFTAGVGIGAGTIWLFGTRSGRRARRQVARYVEDGRERLMEAGENALEKSKDLYEHGRQFVQHTGADVGRRLHLAAR